MSNEEAWWAKTRGLMITCLILWAIFGFVIHFFAAALDSVVLIGFPLGFYMAAQGAPIAFLILAFWFANRQDTLDREHGMAEE